ncbi:MAG: hypothetical protein GF353_08425 [Candidatus Lokiarchaeota archaeon]|nr:hypothetical protein [Candidatus Lokiarchaeota archaeon]
MVKPIYFTKKSKLVSFLLILFFLSVLLVLFYPKISNITEDEGFGLKKLPQYYIKNPKSSDYWPEGDIPFIYIKNDNWTDAGHPWIDGGGSNAGTLEDPHIIENVTIKCQGPCPCIKIENSTDHFIIRNCTLYNAESCGINIDYSENGQILNNTLYENGCGVLLYYSNNSRVHENTIFNNNHEGIFVQGNNNNITFNRIIDLEEEGIYLLYAQNNKISDNKISNCEDGLYIIDSNDNNITYNEIRNNMEYGIYASYADNFIIQNNLLNNLYNVYFNGSSPILMKDNIIVGLGRNKDHGAGVTISESNYLHLENNSIRNTDNALKMYLCQKINITDNFMGENHEGIYVAGSNNVNISENTLENNDYGIEIAYSESVNVSENSMSKCGLGINFNSYNPLETIASLKIDTSNTVNNKPLYYYYNLTNLNSDEFDNAGQVILAGCNNSKIINLNISHGTYGISLYKSNNNTLFNNTASNNYDTGIYVDSSNYINITDNSLNFNSINGIKVRDCAYSNFTGNEMIHCGFDFIGLGRFKYFSSNLIETSNTINGKPLYYYHNETNLSYSNFENAGQVILSHCNDSVISNLNLSYSSYGLLSWNCHNLTIFNVTANNNNIDGIRIDKIAIINIVSSNHNITNNRACNNKEDGIELGGIIASIISENILADNGDKGLNLGGNYVNVTGNIIYQNSDDGINSNGNNHSIKENEIFNNGEDGIDHYYCLNGSLSGNKIYNNGENGLNLFNLNNSLICDNMIYSNGENGIFLEGACYNIIGNNYIKHNIENAIELTDYFYYMHPFFTLYVCVENIIVGNTIINNSLHIDESQFCKDNIVKCNRYIDEMYVILDEQLITTDLIVFTLRIVDKYECGISNANIDMWWNGTSVNANVTQIENGLLNVTLDLILIYPEEDSIMLNMTISADNYYNKYYEILVGVDPEAVDKTPAPSLIVAGDDDDDDRQGAGDGLGILFGELVIGGAIGAAGAMGIFYLIKKKR